MRQRLRATLPPLAVTTVAVTWTLVLVVVALAATPPQPTDVEFSLRSAGPPVGPAIPRVSLKGSPRPAPTRMRIERVRSIPPVDARVLAIGDSVMLGARAAVKRQISSVWMNAAVGRQPVDGVDELKFLRDRGLLRPTVVVHLGDNGRFTDDQLTRMMAILRGVPRVIVVTVKVPRRWEGVVNTALRGAARQYGNMTLVDWHVRWRGCPGGAVFTSDGFHLTPKGARCYANLIAAALIA